MPGKSRQRSQTPAVPAKVYRKSVVIPNSRSQTAVPINRGASINRTQSRTIKRQAINQAIDNQTSRPRPVVRPSAPPQRVMPKTQSKKPVRLARPIASPSATAKLRNLQKSAAPPITPKKGGDLRKPNQSMQKAGAGVLTALALNIGAAHADINADVNALNSSLNELNTRSNFLELLSDTQELDADIRHGLNLLESARESGYVYQKDLEDVAYRAADRWESIRDDLLTSISKQSDTMQIRIRPLGNDVRNLNMQIGNPASALPLISSTKTKVDNLLGDIDRTQRGIESQYNDIESDVYRLTTKLTSVHWALKQLDEAKFKLADNEYLFLAVAARWDQEGKDDPEGVLFLTDKRLIFERKEKVAKKKVLFISVEKELLHEVILDQPVSGIKSTKAENKGLFGHQDFIQLEFSESPLGNISFHLDGQDSKDWVRWIDEIQSGEITNNRVMGSGISHADLTGPLTTADILAVQGEVNQLQDEMMLKGVRQELAGLENDMRELERKLADLRARGYVLEKSLEVDISILAMQWDRIKTNAESTLEIQTQLLAEQMKRIQALLAELVSQSDDLKSARPVYMQLKSAIASAEAQADSAEDTVITQYDEYADEVELLTSHLDWVGWMLDALATASFQLLATESGIAATEAVWERPGLEPENGILFLTDQRILWEDRMDDYELKLDTPIHAILNVSSLVNDENNQQSLKFTLDKPAPYPEVILLLDLPVADTWLKMVGRARSGDYLKDRSVEIDPAELARIQNAPSQCKKCGAAFTAPILRGQVDIICEYCGTVTRI